LITSVACRTAGPRSLGRTSIRRMAASDHGRDAASHSFASCLWRQMGSSRRLSGDGGRRRLDHGLKRRSIDCFTASAALLNRALEMTVTLFRITVSCLAQGRNCARWHNHRTLRMTFGNIGRDCPKPGGLPAVNAGGRPGRAKEKRDDQGRDDLPALFSPVLDGLSMRVKPIVLDPRREARGAIRRL
jgi:hypothetical protein